MHMTNDHKATLTTSRLPGEQGREAFHLSDAGNSRRATHPRHAQIHWMIRITSAAVSLRLSVPVWPAGTSSSLAA